MARLRLPPWFRRGLEAGVFAALLSLVTVVALAWEHSTPGPVILPGGLGSGVTLALPILSVGVLAVAYPIAMAATKDAAILGAVTGWIVGADLLALLTVLMGQRLLLVGIGLTVPIGVAAGLFAAPVALGGLLAAELLTPFGFGRRAGRTAAIVAAVVGAAVILVAVPLVA